MKAGWLATLTTVAMIGGGFLISQLVRWVLGTEPVWLISIVSIGWGMGWGLLLGRGLMWYARSLQSRPVPAPPARPPTVAERMTAQELEDLEAGIAAGRGDR